MILGPSAIDSDARAPKGLCMFLGQSVQEFLQCLDKCYHVTLL